MLFGTVVSGIGSAGVFGTLGHVMPLAKPDERASLCRRTLSKDTWPSVFQR